MRVVTKEDFAIAEEAVNATRSLGRVLDSEERFSVALTGILAASRDFDPEKATWRKYAFNKARFAIIDEGRLKGGRSGQKTLKIDSIETIAAGFERKAESTSVCAMARLACLVDPVLSERETLADTVEELARKLPPQSGEVFRLHWLHGQKFKAIAERLGVGESRVSQIMSRAYAMLRESIPPDFFAKGGAA